ncbi:L,D-transpeptidase family protein [Thiocystis violacea]|uniref:L,D-transpeptidase family protein n=1 Tax=Thiocystis violacea TaxID=13725 RepID=UPI001F5B7539|nr:L,D-transpeptidase family protein [Thiocystis violacea]
MSQSDPPARLARILLSLSLVVSMSALGMSILPYPGSAPAKTERPFDPPKPGMADRLVVRKSERRLYLMRGEQALRTYGIALGFRPDGHKRHEGDGRTPEGHYRIDRRNDRSRYRKSLRISYPNTRDVRRARFRGQSPGGLIMIHGQPNARGGAEPLAGDWTQGCIAVSNRAIDEIWSLTALGTPIEILP